jgi:Cdc6-like AAA superfamily ATPase
MLRDIDHIMQHFAMLNLLRIGHYNIQTAKLSIFAVSQSLDVSNNYLGTQKCMPLVGLFTPGGSIAPKA